MLGSFHQYPHYLKYKRRSSSSSLMSPLLPEHTVESEREKVGTAAGKKAAVKEGLRTRKHCEWQVQLELQMDSISYFLQKATLLCEFICSNIV